MGQNVKEITDRKLQLKTKKNTTERNTIEIERNPKERKKRKEKERKEKIVNFDLLWLTKV